MDSTTVIEKIIKSLSLEVEAILQDKIKTSSSSSESTPVNVRIRVKKKNEASLQDGIISIPKQKHKNIIPQRVRLVSSDQTIMSFNVYVASQNDKNYIKKNTKRIFSVFKPGKCLSPDKDDDEYQYIPSKPPATLKNNTILERHSEDLLEQHFPLRNGNLDIVNEPRTLPNRETYFLGKCKPGGCLDPPFGEDVYPYKPNHYRQSPLKNDIRAKESIDNKHSTSVKRNSITITKFDEPQIKNMSCMSKAIKETENNSILKLYQTDSMRTSSSNTYSNSIITYPSIEISSNDRIKETKDNKRRDISHDMALNSFNEFKEVFFSPQQEYPLKEEKLDLEIQNELKCKNKYSNSSFTKEYDDSTREDMNEITFLNVNLDNTTDTDISILDITLPETSKVSSSNSIKDLNLPHKISTMASKRDIIKISCNNSKEQEYISQLIYEKVFMHIEDNSTSILDTRKQSPPTKLLVYNPSIIPRSNDYIGKEIVNDKVLTALIKEKSQSYFKREPTIDVVEINKDRSKEGKKICEHEIIFNSHDKSKEENIFVDSNEIGETCSMLQENPLLLENDSNNMLDSNISGKLVNIGKINVVSSGESRSKINEKISHIENHDKILIKQSEVKDFLRLDKVNISIKNDRTESVQYKFVEREVRNKNKVEETLSLNHTSYTFLNENVDDGVKINEYNINLRSRCVSANNITEISSPVINYNNFTDVTCPKGKHMSKTIFSKNNSINIIENKQSEINYLDIKPEETDNMNKSSNVLDRINISLDNTDDNNAPDIVNVFSDNSTVINSSAIETDNYVKNITSLTTASSSIDINSSNDIHNAITIDNGHSNIIKSDISDSSNLVSSNTEIVTQSNNYFSTEKRKTTIDTDNIIYKDKSYKIIQNNINGNISNVNENWQNITILSDNSIHSNMKDSFTIQKRDIHFVNKDIDESVIDGITAIKSEDHFSNIQLSKFEKYESKYEACIQDTSDMITPITSSNKHSESAYVSSREYIINDINSSDNTKTFNNNSGHKEVDKKQNQENYSPSQFSASNTTIFENPYHKEGLLDNMIENTVLSRKSSILNQPESLKKTKEPSSSKFFLSNSRINFDRLTARMPINDQISTHHNQTMDVYVRGEHTTEKLKTLTKCYSVGVSIAPTSTINNTTELIAVQLAFQSYVNNNNERIFRTIDIDKEPDRYVNDIVTIVKLCVRLPSKEIRIPIDELNYISFNIIKSNDSMSPALNVHTSTNDQKLVNVQNMKATDYTNRNIQYVTTKENYKKVIDHNLISIYENELAPLQKVIHDLKNDIDLLAGEKHIFRHKLLGVMSMSDKHKKLINIKKKCGCQK